MAKVLKINKGVKESTKEFLKFLLEREKVKGVFTYRKINSNGAVAYSLITDPDMLKDAVPFFPLMPENAGKLLSSFTLRKPLSESIAVVVRPCELRAFIELLKREQGNKENFLFISSTCPGVYPLEIQVNGDFSKRVTGYWDKAEKGEIIPDTRATCQGCEHFLPYNADIIVGLIGKNIDEECEFYLTTDKGEKFIEGIEGNLIEEEIETKEVKELYNKRKEEKERLFEEVNTREFNLSGLVKTFGRCIGCHGCNRVCPICYCVLCDFESRDHEYDPSTYEREMEKRGGVRVPPNTILYHIGRLSHMSVSCVGCGMCADVCPARIPLSTIFLQVGESVQKLFDYIPGKNIEEKVPFTTYQMEELHEVEE